MEASELGNTLANMTSGEESPLGNLVGVGDYQAVFQMAGAVNSLLNVQSSPGSLNDTEEQRNMTAKRKAVRRMAVQHYHTTSCTSCSPPSPLVVNSYIDAEKRRKEMILWRMRMELGAFRQCKFGELEQAYVCTAFAQQLATLESNWNRVCKANLINNLTS